MSLLTTFFNLIKPAKTDGVKVSDFNANMDVIDTEMHKPPLTVNHIEPDATTRDLTLQEVPLATNLSSDIAQINQGTFIERTSGGSSSIEDGYASLVSVKGNMVHTGYVAESIEMTVDPALREEGIDPITATIDRDTFVAYVNASGTITLTYTTAWSADPTNYGITVTGTPIAGDVITVVYVKEDRGTITPATPATFNSTGWNLYDNSEGVKYAKVVKYSDEYGYMIGGNYSLLEFATSVSGAHSAITVADSLFTVPSDGYVFVTGGDATTYIMATWSDWVTGYEGDFQTYTVDTIDLSEIMVGFPYGLLAVGEVRDEINLNAQLAISRIQRLAYTSENLASVIASGVDYDADTNYIYAVRTTPVSTAIELDGEYTVSDHGIEYFTGTTVPLITETLYGENLKDKLRTDVVTISQQTLTDAEKEQVKANIGLGYKNIGSFSTQSSFATALDTEMALMDSRSQRNLTFSFGSTSGSFTSATGYMGFLAKGSTGDTYAVAEFISQSTTNPLMVYASRTGSGWSFVGSSYFSTGQYITVPMVCFGFGASSTSVKFILPQVKNIPSATLTGDFGISQIHDCNATAVTTTSATISVTRENAQNASFTVAGLTGITTNKMYKVVTSGNRRILITVT